MIQSQKGGVVIVLLMVGIVSIGVFLQTIAMMSASPNFLYQTRKARLIDGKALEELAAILKSSADAALRDSVCAVGTGKKIQVGGNVFCHSEKMNGACPATTTRIDDPLRRDFVCKSSSVTLTCRSGTHLTTVDGQPICFPDVPCIDVAVPDTTTNILMKFFRTQQHRYCMATTSAAVGLDPVRTTREIPDPIDTSGADAGRIRKSVRVRIAIPALTSPLYQRCDGDGKCFVVSICKGTDIKDCEIKDRIGYQIVRIRGAMAPPSAPATSAVLKGCFAYRTTPVTNTFSGTIRDLCGGKKAIAGQRCPALGIATIAFPEDYSEYPIESCRDATDINKVMWEGVYCGC